MSFKTKGREAELRLWDYGKSIAVKSLLIFSQYFSFIKLQLKVHSKEQEGFILWLYRFLSTNRPFFLSYNDFYTHHV